MHIYLTQATESVRLLNAYSVLGCAAPHFTLCMKWFKIENAACACRRDAGRTKALPPPLPSSLPLIVGVRPFVLDHSGRGRETLALRFCKFSSHV